MFASFFLCCLPLLSGSIPEETVEDIKGRFGFKMFAYLEG